MKLNTYLNFNGNCQEAISFYHKILGGEIAIMMTHRDSPAAEHTAPEWQDKIMHARLVIGDNVLMASDAPPQYAETAGGFSVSVVVDSIDEGKRIFDGLSEGATITMPFDKTFWAAGFGMLRDQFGIPWMVNCELSV